QAGNVAPGAPGAVALVPVAVVTRALPAADFLVRLQYRHWQLATLGNRGLGDDGNEILRAHNTPHATAAGKAWFAVTGLQLIPRAAGNGGIIILLPVLAGRSEGSNVGVSMPI